MRTITYAQGYLENDLGLIHMATDYTTPGVDAKRGGVADKEGGGGGGGGVNDNYENIIKGLGGGFPPPPPPPPGSATIRLMQGMMELWTWYISHLISEININPSIKQPDHY